MNLDDLKDVQEELIGVSSKWYDIGLQLNMKAGLLQRIRCQYSNPADCLREMLTELLTGINPNPTWEALVEALESRAVNESRLAKKLRDTFLVNIPTTHPPERILPHPTQNIPQLAYTLHRAPTPSQPHVMTDPTHRALTPSQSHVMTDLTHRAPTPSQSHVMTDLTHRAPTPSQPHVMTDPTHRAPTPSQPHVMTDPTHRALTPSQPHVTDLTHRAPTPSQPHVMTDPTHLHRAPNPSQSRVMTDPAYGHRVPTPSQLQVAFELAYGHRVPTPSQLQVASELAYGHRVPTPSQPQVTSELAYGHSVPTYSQPQAHGHSVPTHSQPQAHGHSVPTHSQPQAHGHSVPAHSQLQVAPELHYGHRVPTHSQMQIASEPAYGRRVPTPSQPQVASELAYGHRVPIPSQLHVASELAYGHRVPTPSLPQAHGHRVPTPSQLQITSELAHHIHTYTHPSAEYNPAHPLTVSQQSAHLHLYDLAYFTRPPTANMPSGQTQRPGVPIPSISTHSRQQIAPSNHSHSTMAFNPTPYPPHSPYSIPHYGYKESASNRPQPHPISSAATPIQNPMDLPYHPPSQRPRPHAPLPQYTPAPQMHAVDQYAKYLRAYYQRRKLPTDSKWPPTGSKKYIHLAVVKKGKVSKQQADEFTKATLHGDIEDIIREKGSLDFSGIGKKEDGSPAQLILVEGGPGIGKTTFSWKVCRKWSKGKILQQYRLVVLLRLRDKRVREARTICDLLYYSDDEVRIEIAKEVTRRNGESVLLLYEGFDELPGKLQMQQSIFLDILYQECLPEATVLITSRPSATEFLCRQFKKNIDQHIEILGFTKADVHSYVGSVIKDQQLNKEFTQYLKCYPHIRGLMYVPLNAVIVTEIYKDAKINESEEFVPATLTELYTSLSRGMMLRYLTSHNEHGKQGWKLSSFSDLPEELHKQFYTICGIAFQGILKDEFIFADLAHDFNTLDLMQSVAELYIDHGAVVSHNFFHLTLQEFLAAVHVSHQPEEEQLQYFIQSTPTWIDGQRERERQREREQERAQEREREREQQRQSTISWIEQLEEQQERLEREQPLEQEQEYLSESQEESGSSGSSPPLSTSPTDIIQDFVQSIQRMEPLTATLSEFLTPPTTEHLIPLQQSPGIRKPVVSPTPTGQLQSPGILPPPSERPLTPDLGSITTPSTSTSEGLAIPPSQSSLPPIQLSQLQQVLETLRPQGLLPEPQSQPTMAPSTSTLEPPTILASCVPQSELIETSTLPRPRLLPELQLSERNPLPLQETPQVPQTTPSLTTQDQGRLEPLQVPMTSHPTSETILPQPVSPGMQHTADIKIELQLAEGTLLPRQGTPQVPQTTPSLTTQDQGRLEPLQVPMTRSPTSEPTPPRPESPAIPDMADIGRLQLETPQLEPSEPQQRLSQREVPPITNPRPVIPHTLPVSPLAGSLPYAVLTSSHFQNVVKFTAGLTKLKGIPTDRIKSILLQGQGDYQEIPLYSLHWLFEAQCISKYSEMIAETATLSFNHNDSSMTPFDCFVLGHALSHINSRWDINMRGSLIGDEGLEMMVAGMNYKETTLPPSLKSISLNLGWCAISSVGLSHLKEMPEQVATRITELNLYGNTDISEGVASLLSNLTSLKRLDLTLTSISTQEAGLLAELLSHSQSHKLEYLNLRGSLKSPESTSLILTALSNNTTLREIVLRGAHVSENNLSLLTSALTTNTTLRKLDLSVCKINDNMVSEITSALCDNSTLQTLDLWGNAFGLSGATALAEMLRRNKTLQVLYVWDNAIGEEGTLKLATSLEHNETLEKLWIDRKYKHSLPSELPLKTKNRILTPDPAYI